MRNDSHRFEEIDDPKFIVSIRRVLRGQEDHGGATDVQIAFVVLLAIGLRRARDSWRDKALLKLTCDVCEHRHNERRARRWEAAARRWWERLWMAESRITVLSTRLAEAESRLARLPEYEAECKADYQELQAVCRSETGRADVAESARDDWQCKHAWLMARFEDCYDAAGLQGEARHPVELWNWIEARVESEAEAERELATLNTTACELLNRSNRVPDLEAEVRTLIRERNAAREALGEAQACLRELLARDYSHSGNCITFVAGELMVTEQSCRCDGLVKRCNRAAGEP